MEPLPVIPAPPRRRWREFRVRYLPALVFATTVFSVGHLWKAHVLPVPASSALAVHASTPESTTNLVANLRPVTEPNL